MNGVERALLVAAATLVVLGAVAAVTSGDGRVAPAACAARIADALDLDVVSEASVVEDGDDWVATLAADRLVLRVTGRGGDVSAVEALAGPGADVLDRPDRLRALAVEC